MKSLQQLINSNRQWAKWISARDPDFFQKLVHQQNPQYLWIGCSDSRVPANEIVGLMPGELFVHRNVANVVVHTDLNCLSVIQYAVDVLNVTDIIIVGHYRCGGVKSALLREKHGLIDNWLRHVQDVYEKHKATLAEIEGLTEKWDRLCELNVVEQVLNVCQTTVVQEAWERGQDVTVHGWIYGLDDGLVHDLGFSVTKQKELAGAYRNAVSENRQNVIWES
jgi:carbonic anhydrase